MTSEVVGYVGWAMLACAVIGTQVLAVRSRKVATVGELLKQLTARPVVRAVALLGWLWVGWHFFVRSSR